MVDTLRMESLPSYWKSKNHFDPDLVRLGFFDNTVLTAEEKIDGSQFSFGKVSDQYGGHKMMWRSKNCDIKYDKSADQRFFQAIQGLYANNVYSICPTNVVFRCELVTSKRHNKLTYNRVPNGFLVVFGAENLATGRSVPRYIWTAIAKQLGLDVVDLLGYIDTKDKSAADVINKASEWLGKESMLGGAAIEGVVLKRETNWILNQDGNPIYCKIVANEFREMMRVKETTKGVKNEDDIIGRIVSMIQTDAVYSKAVQHLMDDGKITNTVKDIGPLISEIQKDLGEEVAPMAKEVLWEWARHQVVRGVVTPFALWYKKRLARISASEDVDDSNAQVVGDSVDKGNEGNESVGAGKDPFTD